MGWPERNEWVRLLVLAVLSALFGRCAAPSTVLEFALDWEEAEASGRIPPDADRESIREQTLVTVLRSVDALGVDFRWEGTGANGFRIHLRGSAERMARSVLGAVTARGELEMLIEVRPSEDYPTEGPDRAPRLRDPATVPWPGTREEFREFKAQEVERLRSAEAEGRPYVLSRPPYRLCRRYGRDGFEPDDFAILEVPAVGEFRFEGTMVRQPVVAVGGAGEPVVLFDVAPERQEAFGDFTERNDGLPLGVVLDSRLLVSPVLRGRVRDHVLITLGTGGSRARLEAEAKQLATTLEAGALRVRPRVVWVERTGPGGRPAGR